MATIYATDQGVSVIQSGLGAIDNTPLAQAGVEHAYAIQAGRELRVIVNASQTTDSEAVRICREIARAIEQQLDYPGEIKVTVIRETRAMEIAK